MVVFTDNETITLIEIIDADLAFMVKHIYMTQLKFVVANVWIKILVFHGDINTYILT